VNEITQQKNEKLSSLAQNKAGGFSTSIQVNVNHSKNIGGQDGSQMVS